MASKYQQNLTIPEGFPTLLKEFTREILRRQPDDITKFGSEYFANKMASASDVGQAPDHYIPSAPATKVEPEDVPANATETLVMELFRKADRDGNGTLDRLEFAAVLRGARLALTDRQIRQLLSECDENQDGVIDYREFVPLMLEILDAGASDTAVSQQALDIADQIRNNVEDLLLYGLPRADLEALMLNAFRNADADGSGMLDKEEIRACLEATELGFTHGDVNLLMSNIDLNGDGLVTYAEFLPFCFPLLVERFADRVMITGTLQSPDALQEEVLHCFRALDPAGAGVLPPRAAKAALDSVANIVFPLSQTQLLSLLARAAPEAPGVVHYSALARDVVEAIRQAMDLDHMRWCVSARSKLAAADGAGGAGEDTEQLRYVMHEALAAEDVENCGELSGAFSSSASVEDSAGAAASLEK